jgi:threonine/homoserine/homoserine lactone efflux protein
MAILAGGWEYGRNQAWRIIGGAGLMAVLTLIAAVILAISGHYPQRIFDLVKWDSTAGVTASLPTSR